MSLQYAIDVTRQPDRLWVVTITDQSTTHGESFVARDRKLARCVRSVGQWLHDHAKARP